MMGRRASVDDFRRSLSKAVCDLSKFVENPAPVNGGIRSGQLGQQVNDSIQTGSGPVLGGDHVGAQNHAEGINPSIEACGLVAKIRKFIRFIIRHRGFSRS